MVSIQMNGDILCMFTVRSGRSSNLIELWLAHMVVGALGLTGVIDADQRDDTIETRVWLV